MKRSEILTHSDGKSRCEKIKGNNNICGNITEYQYRRTFKEAQAWDSEMPISLCKECAKGRKPLTDKELKFQLINVKLNTMKRLSMLSLLVLILLSCKAQTVLENIKTNLPVGSILIIGSNNTATALTPGANGTVIGCVNGKFAIVAATQGAQGLQGIQGVPGATGSQGIQGIPGINGTTPTNVLTIPTGMQNNDVIAMSGGVIVAKPASFYAYASTASNLTSAVTLNVTKITTSACQLSGSFHVNSISSGGSINLVYSYTDATGAIQTKIMGTVTTTGDFAFSVPSLNVTANTNVTMSTTFASGTTANYTVSNDLREK